MSHIRGCLCNLSYKGAFMANVLIKIKSLYKSLPATQRQLADYIVQHHNEVPFLTNHDLARLAAVSVATISRFAQTIGYETYKDFKTDLGKDSLVAPDSFGGMFEAIRSSDSDETVIDKAFWGNVTSLNDTLKIIRHKDLIRAAGIFSQAERVVFFGIGSSGHVAYDAALRFSLLDIQSEAYSDSYQILSQSFRMKKNSEIAVGISHSGRSAVTVQALQNARDKGAMTLGISNYLKSPLHEVSRIFFCTSFPESQVKATALSSRIAQLCLIDALYLLVARKRDVSFAKIEQLNSYLETTLRLPGK
jgi:RpiR family transcriptional regulator, carbohydrate utilization regulator